MTIPCCSKCLAVLCPCQSDAMQTLAAENRELRRVVEGMREAVKLTKAHIEAGCVSQTWDHPLTEAVDAALASLSLTQEGE